MRRPILLFIVGLFGSGLLSPFPAFGQDGTAAPEESQAQQDDNESADKEPATDAEKPDTSRQSRSSRLDEFIPTEEISEDKSVSFPVDI